MKALRECFEANRRWVARVREQDATFFDRLREQQRPELLWIGCSDSRIPPDRIIDRQPGAIFVHRNIGNVVVHTDMNCQSVLQYGIEVLAVRHVIVCGHYDCGGCLAALQERPLGLIDSWLGHLRDVKLAHCDELASVPDPKARADRLSELNVAAQVANVCRTNAVQNAWRRGQPLAIHGWIYAVGDGLLRDLDLTKQGPNE